MLVCPVLVYVTFLTRGGVGVQAVAITILSNKLYTSVVLLPGNAIPPYVVLLPNIVLSPGMALPYDVVCC